MDVLPLRFLPTCVEKKSRTDSFLRRRRASAMLTFSSEGIFRVVAFNFIHHQLLLSFLFYIYICIKQKTTISIKGDVFLWIKRTVFLSGIRRDDENKFSVFWGGGAGK